MLLMLFAAAQAAALPAAGGPSPAQPPATMVVEPVAMAIAAFDGDGDARVARAEMEAGVRRSFAAADTAHAGRLRYLDFAEWALRWLGDRNALPSPFEVDSNGDDAVSLAELEAFFAATFTRLDKDRDGYLTRAELLTIRASTGERPDGRRGKRPGR